MLDDYAETNKAKVDEAIEKASYMVLPRQWAYDELAANITKHFNVEREFMPPRTRLERVWNRVVQVLMSFPPYAQGRPIFETMKVFRYSYLACKEFDLLFAKHHRIVGIKVQRPSNPAGHNPFSIFPHSEEGARKWYHPETHGRMIELF